MKILKSDHPTIVSRFLAGETSGDLAKVYDCTRSRILQILKANGIKGEQGGRTIKPKRAAVLRAEKREARAQKHYGVSLETLSEFHKSVHNAYTVHKLNCERRGIPWAFNLETWAKVWEDSGKWEERGKKKVKGQPRYVMAQPDKTQPIGPDNCRVTTLAGALVGRKSRKAVEASDAQ